MASQIQRIRFSQGSVLIVVLILTSMMLMIALIIIESSLLQLKMLSNLKNKNTLQWQAEKYLEHIENQLANGADPSKCEVKFLQFVPDTLHYGELEGVNYYRINIVKSDINGAETNISATYASRNKQEKNPPPLQLRDQTLVEIAAIPGAIVIMDSQNQQILRKFILADQYQQSIIPQSVAIDSQGRGFCDFLYINDGNGYLWKIDLSALSPENWQASRYFIGAIEGAPIVGRDDEGKGVLIYFLLKSEGNQFLLYALNDNFHDEIDIYFITKSFSRIEKPIVLRQRKIILSKTQFVEALTGEIQAKEINSLGRRTFAYAL